MSTKREKLTAALNFKTGRNAASDVREQVFRAVAAKNCPGTVPAIQSRLASKGHEVTAVTVNNHLRALAKLGICEQQGTLAPERRGRPGFVWGLTAYGQEVAELR